MSDTKLPRLPVADFESPTHYQYTAAQMNAYARQCIEHMQAQIAALEADAQRSLEERLQMAVDQSRMEQEVAGLRAAIPEGCTPADAKMLRAANHGLADENSELTETLRDLLGQVNKFCEEQGEADFYTGRAAALLRRLDGAALNGGATPGQGGA